MSHLIEPEDDSRVSIPLRMLDGNLKCLLENTLPVEGISLKHDPNSGEGVILVVHGVDHVAAEKMGFRTQSDMSEFE